MRLDDFDEMLKNATAKKYVNITMKVSIANLCFGVHSLLVLYRTFIQFLSSILLAVYLTYCICTI